MKGWLYVLIAFYILYQGGQSVMARNASLPPYTILTKTLAKPPGSSKILPDPSLILQQLYQDSPKQLNAIPTGSKPYSSTHRQLFQIRFRNIPLHNAYLVVQSSMDGRSWKCTFPQLDVTNIPVTEEKNDISGSESCLVFDEGQWVLCLKKAVFNSPDNTEAWLEFWDESGNLRFQEDWMLRFDEGPDSLIRGCVFRPDPVSKLRQPYGGLLRDRHDSASSVLNQALDTVQIRARFEDDTFRLESPYFRFDEFSAPVRKRAVSVSPDSFLLNRSKPAFEEVNVFYHLSCFRRSLDTLGFASLANYSLPIDVHGMDGADQSAFSPLQNRLAYGDGNVDDAEDAAVIVHEYGHVLSHASLAFGNSGDERRAIEEGICDYLAGSYTRSCSDYEWQNLFKWDGHNEFWAGRTLMSPKIYPDNMVGQMHKDGEIFSSALMTMELAMSRKLVHKLVLGTLPFLIPDLSMPLAAQAFLETDSLLSGGIHTPLLVQIFNSKGIHPGQVIVRNPVVQNTIRGWEIRGNDGVSKEWELVQYGEKPAAVTISDQNGKLLKSFSTTGSELTVPISKQAFLPGIYLLRIRMENEIRTFKLVVFPS